MLEDLNTVLAATPWLAELNLLIFFLSGSKA